MIDEIAQRIVRESGVPELLDLLAQKMPASDLQSLLLRVFEKRSERVNPAKLREQYQQNRFVKPSILDPLIQLKLDRLCFEIGKPNFQPISLSPLAPFGICSAIAPVHQNKIVSTIRNVELGADPTNVMALEASLRRAKLLRVDTRDSGAISLCCSFRATRAQFIDVPNAFAHFQLFALCSAGKDSGNFQFELESLQKHLNFYLRLMTIESDFYFKNIVVFLTPIEKRLKPFIEKMLEKLQSKFPNVNFKFDLNRKNGIGYYQTVCFTINAENAKGEMFHLVDGGITDWTQQFLSSKKERCLISAIGSERVGLLFYQE